MLIPSIFSGMVLLASHESLHAAVRYTHLICLNSLPDVVLPHLTFLQWQVALFWQLE